jgi:hypothetical protein
MRALRTLSRIYYDVFIHWCAHGIVPTPVPNVHVPICFSFPLLLQCWIFFHGVN